MAVISYTLTLMRTDVRRMLQERVEGRFTDTDVDRWINEGATFVAASTRCMRSSTTATAVTGTDEYSMPSDCPGAWAITRLDWDGVPLNEVAFEKKNDALAPGTDVTAQNVPQVWSAYGEKYVLTPPPNSAGTMKAWHAQIPDVITTNDELPLPCIYGPAVILYAVAKGLFLKGAYQLATQTWQQFLLTVQMVSQKGMPDMAKGVPTSAA